MELKLPAAGTTASAATASSARASRIRYTILAMLFIVTTINYADRATISIAGSALQKDLGISAVQLGFVFSAFGWSYVAAQIPGGWLLDRFGARIVYAGSIALWSFFTLLQGTVGFLTGAAAVTTLFALRLAVGAAEAPSFPGNSRLVASWFPTDERGMASAIFNSAQYFATVLFAPIMAWLVHEFGWPAVFYAMGGLGVALSVVWLKVIRDPRDHPRINAGELDLLEKGGALIDKPVRGQPVAVDASAAKPVGAIRQLLGNRMLLGIYFGQYFITTLTYFFLTWFPVYLVQERGMTILKAGIVASVPAIAGFIGGVLGGYLSDRMVRRGFSLTVARKTPIIVGMLLSMTMVACNYIESHEMVIAMMALAFFGKGVGALGWAVVSDTSPKGIAGLSGGLFNTFGNTAGITTPIVIGFIVQGTGSFAGALVYIGANALMAIVCYAFVVGEIKRVELK
ncbi:MFS transporter [Derxia lacustris]|uniref:MFS transporter n=1 Tax=Derxia lacustris TaxID=764842 RepID=UPI000A170946|nr:MFS transporter [Derxia lacustris]